MKAIRANITAKPKKTCGNMGRDLKRSKTRPINNQNPAKDSKKGFKTQENVNN